MKNLFITSVTEYERGWGSRPDGTIAGKTREDLAVAMKTLHDAGDIELYWRCSPVKEVFCDEETYNEIFSEERTNGDGISNISNTEMKKFLTKLV